MDEFFKYGDKYIDEVIRPLLPNASLESFVMNEYYLVGPELLKGSIYERNLEDDNTCFFHFTSISNLLEIIRSKTIRMSDFNAFSDDFELKFANNNLVNEPKNFVEYKSCLFALSMCEASDENLNSDYLWEKYGDKHRGVCIRLSINKAKSVFYNFYLGKILYTNTNPITELEELKMRHDNFKKKHGKAIDNLDEILLTVCSMYKRVTPFKNENEIRLLANIQKTKKAIHTNSHYPIRHKYNSKKDLIEYFLELELEPKLDTENDKSKPPIPYFHIDKIIFGSNCFGETVAKLIHVIEYEFKDSFNKDLVWSIYGGNCV